MTTTVDPNESFISADTLNMLHHQNGVDITRGDALNPDAGYEEIVYLTWNGTCYAAEWGTNYAGGKHPDTFARAHDAFFYISALKE